MSASDDNAETPQDSTAIAAAHDALYAENKGNSPLLRLPAELRDMIYEYVLGGGLVIMLLNPRNQGLPITKQDLKRFPDSPILPDTNLVAITQTCRRKQEEAWSLQFALNTFHINHTDLFLDSINTLTLCQRSSITVISGYHYNFENGIFRWQPDPSHASVEPWGVRATRAMRDMFAKLPGLGRVMVHADVYLCDMSQLQAEKEFAIEDERTFQESSC